MKMRILVSACLLGVCCRYDGGHAACPEVLALIRAHELIPVCPEQLGGLPTPRQPSELRGEGVAARDGADVTRAFRRGAEAALDLARLYGCQAAILKSGSPSCGHGWVYDGTFTGAKRPGSGVAARLLSQGGLRVVSEKELAGLFPREG